MITILSVTGMARLNFFGYFHLKCEMSLQCLINVTTNSNYEGHNDGVFNSAEFEISMPMSTGH